MARWCLCAGVATGVLVVAAVSPSRAEPGFLREWGSFGAGPGEFNLPRGIAVTEDAARTQPVVATPAISRE